MAIGGRVKDASGTAQTGVTVRLHEVLPGNSWQRPNAETLLDEVVTDAEGRWLSTCLDEKRTERVRLEVTRGGVMLGNTFLVTMDQLRARKADVVPPP